MEQQRCFLTSYVYTDKSLFIATNKKKGKINKDYIVTTTTTKNEREDWILIPSEKSSTTTNNNNNKNDDKVVTILNRTHQVFLVSDSKGRVYTVPKGKEEGDWQKWRIIQGGEKGYYLISSLVHSMYLVCNKNGIISCVDERKYLYDEMSNAITNNTKEESSSNKGLWMMEYQSGELCFLSSSKYDLRLSCNPFGNLSMSNNWRGWEVFRLVQCNNNNTDSNEIMITSWTHHTRVLCSNADGEVYTADKKKLESSWKHKMNNKLNCWKIELPPVNDCCNDNDDDGDNDHEGVVIKSVVHNRYLKWDGKKLQTVPSFNNKNNKNSSIDGGIFTWQLESAHNQTYFVSIGSGLDRQLSCSKSDDTKNKISLTKNRKEREEWRLDLVGGDNDDNSATVLYSKVHEKYLGSNPEGEVYLTSNIGDWELWKLKQALSPKNTNTDGSSLIVSVVHNRSLSCSASNNEDNNNNSNDNKDDNNNKIICTVAMDDDNATTTTKLPTSWYLQPRMPPTLSGGQMAAYTISVTLTLASIIATPFVVKGVVGALGFGSASIAASSSITSKTIISEESTTSDTDVVAAEGGKVVPFLQSIGAYGLSLVRTATSVGTGAVIGVGGGFSSAAIIETHTRTTTARKALTQQEAKEGQEQPRKRSVMERNKINRPFCAWREW